MGKPKWKWKSSGFEWRVLVACVGDESTLDRGDLSWSCVYGVLKLWLWRSCNNQDFFWARTDMIWISTSIRVSSHSFASFQAKLLTRVVCFPEGKKKKEAKFYIVCILSWYKTEVTYKPNGTQLTV